MSWQHRWCYPNGSRIKFARKIGDKRVCMVCKEEEIWTGYEWKPMRTELEKIFG